jgi:hypothetical protein
MISLPLAFWTPLAGALLIMFTRWHPAIRDALSMATAMLLFAAVASLAPAVFDGARPTLTPSGTCAPCMNAT